MQCSFLDIGLWYSSMVQTGCCRSMHGAVVVVARPPPQCIGRLCLNTSQHDFHRPAEHAEHLSDARSLHGSGNPRPAKTSKPAQADRSRDSLYLASSCPQAMAWYEAFYRLAEFRTTTKVVAGTLAKMTFESSGVWCSGASVVLARFPEFLELNAIEDQAARRTCHQVAFWMMTD